MGIGKHRTLRAPAIGPCRELEVDDREHLVQQVASEYEARKKGFSRRELELPGGVVTVVDQVHESTGRVACLKCLRGGDETTSYPAPVRAQLHAQQATVALDPGVGPLGWFPDSRRYTTSSGREVVHLHQHYAGVPVFEAMRTVIYGPRATLLEVGGDHVRMPGGLRLEPAIEATDAVLVAARYLAEPIERAMGKKPTEYPPRVLGSTALPARPTFVHKLPFDDPVLAHLILVELVGGLQLAWFISASLPRVAGSWDLILAADGEEEGALLWARDNICRARPATGEVWLHDPEDPARRRLDFPRPLAELPAVRPREPLPAGFPWAWVADLNTSGNNAIAEDFAAGRTLAGVPVGGVTTFQGLQPESEQQQVLNAFYYSNYVHDLLYLLGFDEKRGNFQKKNFTSAPHAGDRLEVFIETVVAGDARFVVREDGRSAVMSLGPTAAGRHTALSADVVLHECIHGLTDRLVAGRDVLHPMQQSFQSRALDEGICDWFAITIQNHGRADPAAPAGERLVFGAWPADDALKGMRPRSYDGFTCGIEDLRRAEFEEEHAAGQVWCAVLLEVNRRLGQVVGDVRQGHEIGWQVMVDALKEMSKTPLSVTFLSCRKRFLDALDALAVEPPTRAGGSPLLPAGSGPAARIEAEAAFADFGMGPSASCPGPDFRNAAADPPGLRCP